MTLIPAEQAQRFRELARVVRDIALETDRLGHALPRPEQPAEWWDLTRRYLDAAIAEQVERVQRAVQSLFAASAEFEAEALRWDAHEFS